LKKLIYLTFLLISFVLLSSAQAKVKVNAFTFREPKYGQPFVEIDWFKLSRKPCTIFRPEEKIFIHFEIRGYDSKCPHKVVVAYHLPGKIVSRPEKWAINPSEGLGEHTIFPGQKKFVRDACFREGFFFAQPGPRLIEIYFDPKFKINYERGTVDFYSKPIKKIIVKRKGELKL